MRELRPLLTVLADVALVRPGAVLVQGHQYWPASAVAAQARRDAVYPEHSRALRLPEYWWETDAHDRVVIWRKTQKGKEAVFAEAGSDVRVG